MSIKFRNLRDDLSFGTRISGVTKESLKDEALCKEINRIFYDRGMIVFEGVEPSSEMQLALSNVFGTLKDHPVDTVERVDQNRMPGVIEMKYDPNSDLKDKTIVEIEGEQLTTWLPWHFDHCYNDELNRAGILRAVDIPPERGLTGFADGLDLYRDFSSELRDKIESIKVIYSLDLIYAHMRFGRPEMFSVISDQALSMQLSERAKTLPRAIHPAIWMLPSGEKVLHVSPWMAEGVEGHEDAVGDKLLEDVCQEIYKKIIFIF